MPAKGQIRLTGEKEGEVFLNTVKHITPAGCPIMCFWLPATAIPTESQRKSRGYYVLCMKYSSELWDFCISIRLFSCWFLYWLCITYLQKKHFNFLLFIEKVKKDIKWCQTTRGKYDKVQSSPIHLFNWREMRGRNENIAKSRAKNIREATLVRPCMYRIDWCQNEVSIESRTRRYARIDGTRVHAQAT